VGLKLYAIGFAQYLVYPTLAVLAWPLLERRDRDRLVFALAGLGVLVAVSIFLEAEGVPFVEAVRAAAPGGGIRYGGATGSYLHASIFLGTTAVLTAGALLSRWSRRGALVGTGALGVILAGLGLTYSRGGVAIAAIGLVVLLVVLRGARPRLTLIAVAVVATGIGLGLSAVIGASPAQVASRTGSGTSIQADRGNQLRLEAMRDAIHDYKQLPALEKAIGQGLASTGNAGKLASTNPNPTESYPLKLLLEVGIVGLLAIGAIIVWAVVRFAMLAWSATDPLLKGVGAAGLALSADALAYPTLEVQLIALVWWLLVVLCLGPRDRGAKSTGPASDARFATRERTESERSSTTAGVLSGGADR
jgi:hypothetical protein